ncbi:MAG: translation initiation factor [Nitrospirota bacterium]
MSGNRSRLVYSTEKPVPRKARAAEPAAKPPHEALPPSHQKITVRLERKGRGGKAVSIIEGLSLSSRDREAFLKQLKAKLGAGGTLKEEAIEIQGDHRDALIAHLDALGYRPKRSGG